jgi:hypothetical protein
MENQTALAEQTVNENQYQAPNPKPTLPSKAPAAGAERKWQLISLLTGIFLIAAVAIIVWMYAETSSTKTLQSRLEIENQSLKEQLNLAGTQITGLKNEMESLLNQPAKENPDLKSQNVSSVAAASRSTAASRQSPSADISRINVMKKGTYSKGTTKDELIAAIGEPDRVYNSRGYEQLVYFGKKPGRFWLIDERVVQVGG